MKEQQHPQAKEILQRYVAGQCTDEERAWVEEWYKENYSTNFEIDPDLADEHFAAVWQRMESSPNKKRRDSLWRSWSIAASILVVLGLAGWYFWPVTSSEVEQRIVETSQKAIQPGRDQALLTLADGRIINLDSITVGANILENGMSITKMADGTLSYTMDTQTAAMAKDSYNTISTPRGGQYKIMLPDHSVVWLNAASSLRFPVTFTGSSTRLVVLDGEGYFEVASDQNKPFIVESQNQQTIVKGTKFNISAYRDDQKKITTLLEGSVLIKAMTEEYGLADEVLLRPHEQTVIQNNKVVKTKVDASEAIAWKNGKFIYNNTPLMTIMKQLARWYDVEVVYLESMEGTTFTGSLSRFENIEDVLRKISLTESVRFETRERRIMVQH